MPAQDKFQILCNRARRAIIDLNLFDIRSTDPILIHRERMTTRLFLILFAISIFILLLYTTLSVQTKTVSIQQPSMNTFVKLQQKFANSLQCPCAHISIPYGSIVQAQPLFHQVCRSDFVSQSWIDFIFDTNETVIWAIDVRKSLSAMWQLIAALCQSAANNVWDSLNDFSHAFLISPITLSEPILKAKAQAALDGTLRTTINSFSKSLIVLEGYTQANGYMTGVETNFALVTPNDLFSIDAIMYILERIYVAPGSDDECYCYHHESCPIQGGLYLYNTMTRFRRYDINKLTPNATIPGLELNCLPTRMALGSTLECFYNRSCLDLLLSVYPRKMNVSQLTRVSSSRFPPETLVKRIVDELFLEEMINETSFHAYYQRCAPLSCTYTFSQQFDWIFVGTTLIALIGGLNAALRLFTPYLFYILLLLKKKLSSSVELATPAQSKEIHKTPTILKFIFSDAAERLNWRDFVAKIKMKIVELSIFDNNRIGDEIGIRRSCIATRLFIGCMAIALITLIIYTAQSAQIITKTIPSPSQVEYEALQGQYPNTLQCPCSVVSITYKEFIEITPTYHQLCSSNLITPQWYRSLLYPRLLRGDFDFRLLSSSYFRTLHLFCDMALLIMTAANDRFSFTEFVNSHVISRLQFETQINASIVTFQSTTVGEFLYASLLVGDVLRANEYASGLETNAFYYAYYLIPPSLSMEHPITVDSLTWDFDDNNGTHTYCARDPQKLLPSNHEAVLYIVPGIVIPCTMIGMALLSSLSCWYNITCLESFTQSFEEINVFVYGNVSELYPTQHSRFVPDTKLETIFNAMMIEDFNSSIFYDAFYRKCQPTSCTFTYRERSSLAFLITTVLGLFGGLNIILRLLCLGIIKLIIKRKRTSSIIASSTTSSLPLRNERKYNKY
jgi:hypothetical protein